MVVRAAAAKMVVTKVVVTKGAASMRVVRASVSKGGGGEWGCKACGQSL